MVRHAVERGHEVSIFTRGRTQADIPDVEHLVGDRNNDLKALEGRRWDVVLDNNARDYRWVRLSTDLLRDAAEQYVFVSSISAYTAEGMGYEHKGRVLWEPLIDEDSERFSPPQGWQDGAEAPYGLTKALSENIAHAAFPGRTTVVRPGLIVGPGDPTDRFTYWPVRIDEGGEVLAPGNPEHANQVIDQRDLTEWIVRLAEKGTIGDFNATGPAARMSMAEMLYGIRAITSTAVRFTWLEEDFLEEHEVRPWGDLPAWIPGDGLMYVDIRRALDAGLTFRPLAVTAHDTLEWDRTRPYEERANRRAGMSRQRERELLAAWHRRQGLGEP
jgi:2'-hydroxyisoflavone reductase